MKKVILALFVMFLLTGGANAQTATNFSCNDCSGVFHDLFTELDAGKVIVISWIMPCGSCITPAVTAYNVVQGFQSSHSGQVFFYLVDDYANTACPVLNSWANSYNIPENAFSRRFVNSSIDMLDYGSAGMPKTIVLGGVYHAVFYDAINGINSTMLTNAINTALVSTGLNEVNSTLTGLHIYPNPSNEIAKVKFELKNATVVNLELFDLQGKSIKTVSYGKMASGKQEVELKTASFPAGMYLVKVSGEGVNSYINLMIAR